MSFILASPTLKGSWGITKSISKIRLFFVTATTPRKVIFGDTSLPSFDSLKFKKLVSTHLDNNGPSYKLEMFSTGSKPVKTTLEQNGDFRSSECIEILKEADVVVTNPPFSLFREYVAQLVEYNKTFLIIGHKMPLHTRNFSN